MPQGVSASNEHAYAVYVQPAMKHNISNLVPLAIEATFMPSSLDRIRRHKESCALGRIDSPMESLL